MKSGENGLIGPGDNDYGRQEPHHTHKVIKNEKSGNLVKELTPELADKIWKSIEKAQYDNRVSKEKVLHHLKQLKAQMGKYMQTLRGIDERCGVQKCMEIIDKKIAKINEIGA